MKPIWVKELRSGASSPSACSGLNGRGLVSNRLPQSRPSRAHQVFCAIKSTSTHTLISLSFLWAYKNIYWIFFFPDNERFFRCGQDLEGKHLAWGPGTHPQPLVCVSLELYFPSCLLHTFSFALWDLRQGGPQALPSVRGLLCFRPIFLGSEWL